MKKIILSVAILCSLKGFSQENFEIKVTQTNYLCCQYQFLINEDVLIIEELKVNRNERILKQKIPQQIKQEISELVQSERINELNNNYINPSLDGIRWEYQINTGPTLKTIIVENESVPILLELNQVINKTIKRKRLKLLLEKI